MKRKCLSITAMVFAMLLVFMALTSCENVSVSITHDDTQSSANDTSDTKNTQDTSDSDSVLIVGVEANDEDHLILKMSDNTVKDLGILSDSVEGLCSHSYNGETLVISDKGLMLVECTKCGLYKSEKNTNDDTQSDTNNTSVTKMSQNTSGNNSVLIVSVEANDERHLILKMSDGTVMDAGILSDSAEGFCSHSYNGDTIVIKEPSFSEEGVTLVECTKCGLYRPEKTDKLKSSEGLEYTKISDDTEYSVNSIGTCTDSYIVIPDCYEGLPVTEIGEKAFFGSETIISVKLPESIKKIGNKAFSDCSSLSIMNMPDSVELGIDVFRGSINVELEYKHSLVFVERKDATCNEPGCIEHYYCEVCDEYYSDSNGKNRLYSVEIPAAHSFNESGYCTLCGTPRDDIKIVSINNVTHLGKFAPGTMENAIGLPAQINVQTANGAVHAVDVIWDLSTYNKAVAGTYTITGHLQAGAFVFADGLSDEIVADVEIVEHMKGTADIVFVLDISGSMGDEIANVKNNIVNFAQKIEEQGVSARWSAITYSDSADVPSDPNEKTKVLLNGASNWFTSAEDYKGAINSITLAYGGDNPEMAVDGLMMADSLEKRQDARVFYILLTDATYKNDNNFGVANMKEATEIFIDKNVNVSVITASSCKSEYTDLATSTGGIMTDIYGNFAQDLIDNLVPIIYDNVIA